MERKTPLFESYLTITSPSKVVIKAGLAYRGLEKFGYPFIALIPSSIIWFIDFSLPDPVQWPLRITLMVLAYFITRKFVHRYLSRTILILDKTKHVFKSDLDAFEVPFTDIKDVLTEEVKTQSSGKENTSYSLKYLTPNGTKSSAFAFTSYNNVNELASVIMNVTQEA
jgi:hypothetical protein